MSVAPKVAPLGPQPLCGRFVALEPLAPQHRDVLRQAADADTFRHMPTPDFDSWLAKAEADSVPLFVVAPLTVRLLAFSRST